ncbi:MAG: AMP-binding protein [Proteobacteria bacterium]|nr:AMP-binding protein [Pseudomonadota bacterium]
MDNERLWEACRPVVEADSAAGEHFKRCVLALRDTLPKVLADQFRSNPGLAAMRKKDFGVWNSYTWAEVWERTKHIALGLRELGLRRGDKAAVIGDNDPEWYWIEMAVQALGGVCVGLYIDAMPSDAEYIVNHSDAVFVFAKDQEQTDKFLEIRDKLPQVRRVIFWDDKGMASYRNRPWLLELRDLMELGRESDRRHPEWFEQFVEETRPEDLALLCYTSGTTSLPKGVMISQSYLIQAAVRWGTAVIPQPTDNYLSYVPPAWVAEQLQLAACMAFGVRINFPEKPETVMEDIREIGPQSALLSPMQWQGIFSQVQMKIFDTGPIRRSIYRLCLPVGYRMARYAVDHECRPPRFWRLLYLLADGLCFRHMRDYLGLSRLRYGITGGSALGPDVFRWFMAIGVRIKDGYGLTELSPATVHRYRIIPGTSGQPVPGVEVRISEAGEVWLRSDVRFDGYYKNEEATAEVLSEDGWIRTGDCGTVSLDGHLIIYDRLKEMLPLRGGGVYSPTYIQNRLKFSPYVKEAMVVGGRDRDSIFAIITIDFDNVGRWAEKNRLSYTTFVDLSQKNEVYDLIRKDVDRVNQTLPLNARIGRYTLLHKEFDADESELTRTRKLRRAFLEQRYAELIGAAYAGRDGIAIEAEVKYRDGRSGTIKTNLKIRGVPLEDAS